MKENIFKILIIVLILLIAGTVIVVAVLNNNEDSAETLKEKALEEINYLDTNLIIIANKLNNITYKNYSIKLNKNEATSSQDSSNNEESSSSSGEAKEDTRCVK